MKKAILFFLTTLYTLNLSAQVVNNADLKQKYIFKQGSSQGYYNTHPNIYDSITKKNIPINFKLGVTQASTGQEPLYIIDGKKRGHKPKSLNVSEIKSISVLKGPNATNRYGKKGKNGVILITTKTASF
jgi:TonB-dependent SusC/RagA subfamily outer membrane receptor